jgi:hypothetical protein
MDVPWVSMDFRWFLNGFPWIVDGISMDFHPRLLPQLRMKHNVIELGSSRRS